MRLFPRRSFRFLGLATISIASLLLASCGMYDAPQTTFVPHGSAAQHILDLFKPVFWLAVAVFVIVEGLLIWSLIRYRRKPDDGIPLQIHGNTTVEIAWTILPAIIVVGIATMTFRTQAILDRPEQNALQVNVIGHQWWWEFQYPELGVVTANELHLPANRPVEFALSSVDVIHSFWLPRVSGKTDLIPGHVNRLSFTTGEPGTQLIRGQCAEFCGGTHAMMSFHAAIDSQADFDRWAAQQKTDAPVPAGVTQNAQPAATTTGELAAPNEVASVNQSVSTDSAQQAQLAAQGYKLFAEKGCVGCHSISGYTAAVGKVGPNLTHVGSRQHIVAGWLVNTPENMQRWLRDPGDVKPENLMANAIKRGTLKEDEIAALTVYLESLK